jgi:hypothetical protein
LPIDRENQRLLEIGQCERTFGVREVMPHELNAIGEGRPRNVQKEDRRRSGSCAVVIVKHSAETLAPMHRLRWRDDRGWPKESVFEALMVSLGVIVRHELRDRVLKRVLTEEDHSVQALGFY